MFYYVHTMQLSCKCGASWEYKGRAEVYACCPRCKSKVKIDSEDGPLCLERWAVRVPLEITLPDDLQKAAEEFFQGRRPGPYSHIALASVIRHKFSNYDELIFQLENKSLASHSHPKEERANEVGQGRRPQGDAWREGSRRDHRGHDVAGIVNTVEEIEAKR